jgi:hypothetical protein
VVARVAAVRSTQTQVLLEQPVKVMQVVTVHNTIHLVVVAAVVLVEQVVMAQALVQVVLDYHHQLQEVQFFVLVAVVHGTLFQEMLVVMEAVAKVLITARYMAETEQLIEAAVAAVVQDFNQLMPEEQAVLV